MKKIFLLLFPFLILQILSQLTTNNSNTQQNITQEKEVKKNNETVSQNNTNQQKPENSQKLDENTKIQNKSEKKENINENNQKPNQKQPDTQQITKVGNKSSIIGNTSMSSDLPKNNTNVSNNEAMEKEKLFNLTESFMDFYRKMLERNETNQTKINLTLEKIEEQIKSQAAKRNRKIREDKEFQEKTEKIQMKNKTKAEMKKKKEQEEREQYEMMIANTSFGEFIQISLEKGETESLYFDLDSFSRVKMGIILTDEEEKISFVFSGPNAHGRNSVIYRKDNINYFYYEYEALRKGEYIVEITNRGGKENELVFLVREENDKKKKDLIDTEKVDKISALLNNIDENINKMRNKKKIEIKQVNSHNDKVDKNNRSIVIYSVIEIFTMIFVFIAQSYYISSMINKI